jgi:hypothetical protein
MRPKTLILVVLAAALGACASGRARPPAKPVAAAPAPRKPGPLRAVTYDVRDIAGDDTNDLVQQIWTSRPDLWVAEKEATVTALRGAILVRGSDEIQQSVAAYLASRRGMAKPPPPAEPTSVLQIHDVGDLLVGPGGSAVATETLVARAEAAAASENWPDQATAQLRPQGRALVVRATVPYQESLRLWLLRARATRGG